MLPELSDACASVQWVEPVIQYRFPCMSSSTGVSAVWYWSFSQMVLEFMSTSTGDSVNWFWRLSRMVLKFQSTANALEDNTPHPHGYHLNTFLSRAIEKEAAAMSKQACLYVHRTPKSIGFHGQIQRILCTYGQGFHGRTDRSSMDVRSKGLWTYVLRGHARTSLGCLHVRP